MKIKLKEKLLSVLSVAKKTVNGYNVTMIKIKTQVKNKIVRI